MQVSQNDTISAAVAAMQEHAKAVSSRFLAKKPSGKYSLTDKSAKATITIVVRTRRDAAGRIVTELEWSESIPPAEVSNSLTFGGDEAMPEPSGGSPGNTTG